MRKQYLDYNSLPSESFGILSKVPRMSSIFAGKLDRVSRMCANIKTPVILYREITLACFSRARSYSRVIRGKPKKAEERPDHSTAFTPPEVKQIKELLRKGFQTWEIALRFQQYQSTVIATVEANAELASQVKAVKTGRWSELEDQYILKLIGNRRLPYKESIAHKLGLGVDSVAQRLGKMVAERASSIPSILDDDLDRDLSEEEQAILMKRMCRIIERLLNEDVTPEWQRILTAKSAEDWAARL